MHKGGEKSWRAWLDLIHDRLKEKNLDDFEDTPPHSVLQCLSLQILVIHRAEKANGQLGFDSVTGSKMGYGSAELSHAAAEEEPRR